MSTKRNPISRRIKTQITPPAIDAYRRFRSWDGKCACPPYPPYPPYPSQASDNSNPEHRARFQAYNEEYAAYERERAKCLACPARAAEYAFLLRELNIKLKPWEQGLKSFPEIVRALDEALAESAAPRTERPAP